MKNFMTGGTNSWRCEGRLLECDLPPDTGSEVQSFGFYNNKLTNKQTNKQIAETTDDGRYEFTLPVMKLIALSVMRSYIMLSIHSFENTITRAGSWKIILHVIKSAVWGAISAYGEQIRALNNEMTMFVMSFSIVFTPKTHYKFHTGGGPGAQSWPWNIHGYHGSPFRLSNHRTWWSEGHDPSCGILSTGHGELQGPYAARYTCRMWPRHGLACSQRNSIIYKNVNQYVHCGCYIYVYIRVWCATTCSPSVYGYSGYIFRLCNTKTR